LTIEIRRLHAHDHDAFRQVLALGRKNAKYLGFMPKGGYEERIRKGTLLIADRENTVLGYVMYDLPRGVIHIAHICVAEVARRGGLARLLVEEVSRRHADRRGVELLVRNDFPAYEMWYSLGFSPQSETVGRGAAGQPKTLMWLDHGQPDLFTWAERPDILLTAVVDASVFYDLHPGEGRRVHAATAEMADAISTGQLELVVAPELEREISRHAIAEERQRLRGILGVYRRTGVSTNSIKNLVDQLVQIAKQKGRKRLSSRDVADLSYVAAASIAGVGTLVTKDERFVKWARTVAAGLDIDLLDPRGVIIRLDEIARASSYSPRTLLGTSLDEARVSSRDLATLHERFLNSPAGESKQDFKALLASALGSQATECWTIRAEGELVALWSQRRDGDDLVADLVRVADDRSGLSTSLGGQLVFMLRDRARTTGAARLIISDVAPSRVVMPHLRRDGFVEAPGGLTAPTPRGCQPRSAWVDALRVTRSTRGSAQLVPALDLCIQERQPTPAEASEWERLLWPAKLADAPLPSFLVPIRQLWSAALFGVPASLEPRSTGLGLSREHIYYRAPKPAALVAPARVIWYLTQGRNQQLGPGAFACSRLEEVVVDAPDILYSRFRHLGVYEQEHVTQSARGGYAQAMRIADTELFSHLVGLDRLRVLADRSCQTLHLRSPQRLDSKLFESIYREGALSDA
jgi:predicted nucleic acid-binding protein/GNAT superfamily N-acetyltransferase